ncbi:Plasmid stabilization system protein [Polystyrenella longa]|uniref:Plasmid stabilization system protein n=1 Tax=Polystyrenella longa TaxID=2528007 RepID=A0A518CND5_9PLAN|nr:type II toxin-antitoxin system RelE/ParE family toxin [Polystyrenella longa]QDU80729.1 Plasmid stabilization system protein [Polystyrenella longa]
MKYPIEYTEPAKNDIEEAVRWWRDHRSPAEASKWLAEIEIKINKTLSSDPERLPLAPESDLSPYGLRQLMFGLGRRLTHRIVFTIRDGKVFILRVRHAARKDLTQDDLN